MPQIFDEVFVVCFVYAVRLARASFVLFVTPPAVAWGVYENCLLRIKLCGSGPVQGS